MNQTVLKQPLQATTSGQNNNSIVLLARIKHEQIQARIKAANMLKQHLIGGLILAIGIVTALMTMDLTALIILAPFSILTFVSKDYILINSKGDNNNVHSK